MVDLPAAKVGIIACSGEELPEGTVTRLAALRVLEQLRPDQTVTICLPLFLAGGEGERAFARYYPTITLDGCYLRCAQRGAEQYSGKPAASLVVSDLLVEHGLPQPHGCRRLDAAGMQAVELAARLAAEQVDALLARPWNRRTGLQAAAAAAQSIPLEAVQVNPPAPAAPVEATCACGSGIPVRKVEIGGRTIEIVALPLIFQQLYEAGQLAGMQAYQELFQAVAIYNPIPDGQEDAYRAALNREYLAYCLQRGKNR